MQNFMFKIKVINRCGFMLLGVALLMGVASCKKDGAATKPDDVDYYTCAMHPSVKSQDPKAKCPICSMDLIPVLKKGANLATDMPGHVHGPSTEMAGDTNLVEQPTEFSVPVARQQL